MLLNFIFASRAFKHYHLLMLPALAYFNCNKEVHLSSASADSIASEGMKSENSHRLSLFVCSPAAARCLQQAERIPANL